MNFYSRCDEFKNYTIQDVINHSNYKKNGLFYSYNHKNVINNETKKVIVGTFTPPCATKNEIRNTKSSCTMNDYYFYCSTSQNQLMYSFIDNAFNQNDYLSNLRFKLPNKSVVEKIKKNLTQNKIAFLDVIEAATFYDVNSSKDDDITCFKFDFDSFEEAYDSNNEIDFIPNSERALYALEIINKHFDNKFRIIINNNPPYIGLPYYQNPRAARYKARFGFDRTKDILKNQWESVLK